MSIDSKTLIEGAKLFPAPIKSFNNIWDITIGNRLEAWNQKSVFKNQQDVEKYKNECLYKISQISPDKFQDSKLSLIGPTLEASKFYIEEDSIRNMFSNLIAASMNSDYNDKVHHSFTEITKQLGPLDAKLLSTLSSREPIIDINIKFTDFHGFSLYNNFYFNSNVKENLQNTASIDNLVRLGIAKILEEECLTDSSFYQRYVNSDLYREYVNKYSLLKNKDLNISHKNLETICSSELSFDNIPLETKVNNLKEAPVNIVIKEKTLILTSFGESFKKVCCSNLSK